MTLRAAAISASETRPSDLATWPMTSNVAVKNRSPISSTPAPPPVRRTDATLWS